MEDSEAVSASGQAAVENTACEVHLSWSVAQDNVAATTYSYSVVAIDAQGNPSAESPLVQATTL